MDRRLDAPDIEFYSHLITAAHAYRARNPLCYTSKHLSEFLEVIRDEATDA